MKRIADRLLQHSSIQERPPVLVDIGASGGLPPQWKLLAPYSICIAFDADTRDFEITQSSSSGWKTLYSLNRLVAPKAADAVDFYLTKSPHCSSSLPPLQDALAHWSFAPLFETERVVQLPATDLTSTLKQLGIEHIDWYKTDSQGTDLRLFRSLPENISANILSAEFEPGIIDAYAGEDKLCTLMQYMDTQPFWVSDMTIKGSQRFPRDSLSNISAQQRQHLPFLLKTSPGWCEISYLHQGNSERMGTRELLLLWLFSSIRAQHGFSIHVAEKGAAMTNDPLFGELLDFSRKQIAPGQIGFIKKAIAKAGSLF